MASTTLTTEFNKKLISLIRGHPVLYNKMTVGSVKQRERIWEEIGNQMECDVHEVKKRWKNIRDNYHRNRKYIICTGLNKRKYEPSENLKGDLDFLEFADTRRVKKNKKKNKSIETEISMDSEELRRIMEEDLSEDKNSGEVALTVTDIDKYMQYRNSNTKNTMTLPEPESTNSISDSGTFKDNKITTSKSFGCIKIKPEFSDGDNEFDTTETEVMQVNQISNLPLNDEEFNNDTLGILPLGQDKKLTPEIIDVRSCASHHEMESNIQLVNIVHNNESIHISHPGKSHASKNDIDIDNNQDDIIKRITIRNDQKNLVKMMKMVLKQNKILKNRLANKTKKKNTPTHSFFSSMADIVSNFPAETVADVRMKICTIVTSAELSCMNNR
ncbi:hypothetical protein JYU34_006570 [Plutella xylostella]|uniref:MADF domain-containing protein n=1 Tax=Plutella xylostella TaxID=51655 RepID=A0ABQ7QSB1_PLUXY|nr:hypothetical protein JYU34_006570 [Plutella xylostella]